MPIGMANYIIIYHLIGQLYYTHIHMLTIIYHWRSNTLFSLHLLRAWPINAMPLDPIDHFK